MMGDSLDVLLTSESEALDALLAQVGRASEETRKTLERKADEESGALEVLLAGLTPSTCPYCRQPMKSEATE